MRKPPVFAPPVFAPQAQRRHSWDVMLQLAQRLGVPLLPLSTQEDLVEQLRDLLEQHQPGYRA